MRHLEQVANSLLTLTDCIRWGASQFNAAGLHFGHGTDNALDEAFGLALQAVHLPFDLHPRYLDARLTVEERLAILSLFDRRIRERRPAAYLTGEAWFAGLPFFVDERVLVPRSPLAEWIARGFDPWLDAAAVSRVLDLGTGSGCIAIACAMAFPEAQVDAADIDPDALAVAARNVARHQLENHVHLHQSDVYAGLPAVRYDLIISNPPYVDAADFSDLPPEYRHEPDHALAAGTDGLNVVRQILAGAGDRLNPGGILVVEVGNSAEAVARTWLEVPFTWLAFEHGEDGVFLLTAEQLHDDAVALGAGRTEG